MKHMVKKEEKPIVNEECPLPNGKPSGQATAILENPKRLGFFAKTIQSIRDMPAKWKARHEAYKALNKKEKGRWWSAWLIKNAIYIIFTILIIVTEINSLVDIRPSTHFLQLSSIFDIINKSSFAMFIALGVGGCIVLTGTDLSAGRMMGFVACICAALLQVKTTSTGTAVTIVFPGMGNWPVIVVLLVALLVGGIIGAVNGFFVSKFSLHPFIVTLGTSLMLQGLALWFTFLGTNSGQTIRVIDSYKAVINKAFTFSIGGQQIIVNWYMIYAILAIIIMWFIWNKTKFGKNMYAVGANQEAARVSGVNVMVTIIMVFALAGIFYGFSGFTYAAVYDATNANSGVGAELDAIAACVIGGVSFTGGTGKVSGIVLGVILLQIITVALSWLGINPNLTYVIKGVIILFAVTIDMKKYLVKR